MSKRKRSMILSWILTVAAVAFCMVAGAAGYKQITLAKEPEPVQIEKPEPAPEVSKTVNRVTVYNISTNAAMFLYEEPVIEPIAEEDEIELLAKCVEAEAGNQTLEGKRLVCDVILNRVDDSDFPDTITEVIAQPYQFSTYWNGAIDKADPSEETYLAVNMEIKERSYPSLMFFDCGEYLPYGTPWKQVGGHYFSIK